VCDTTPAGVTSPWAPGRIDVAEQSAAGDFGRPRFGIDHHVLHQRQVEHDAAIASRQAGKAVPAAADSKQGLPLGGNTNDLLYVTLGYCTDDCHGPAIDQAVVDPAQAVILDVVAGDKRAIELRARKHASQCGIIHPQALSMSMPASLTLDIAGFAMLLSASLI
jgi:hypothetical protein